VIVERNAGEAGILSRYQVLIVLLSLCCLIIIPSISSGSDSVSDVARSLVNKLHQQTSLTGLSIQVDPAHFSEHNSGFRSLFSTRLAESLTVALTTLGARVSLQETGREPLRLIGSYFETAGNLEITVRLRKMGRSASFDLGAARSTLVSGKIDPALLRHSLDCLAAELIRQLEKTCFDVSTISFNVIQPVPGIPGQPTLKLGSVLKEMLERAILRSELFGTRTISGGALRQVRITSSYTVGDSEEPVHFTASLRTDDDVLLSQAAGQLEKKEIPRELYEMIQDRSRDICVTYRPADRRAVPEESPVAGELIAGIGGALNSVGIQPVPCGRLKNGIRIEVSMQISQKKMADGYGILIGDMRLQLFDDDKPSGLITGRKKQSFAGHANESRSTLIEKFFTSEFRTELSGYVLAWRHGGIESQ